MTEDDCEVVVTICCILGWRNETKRLVDPWCPSQDGVKATTRELDRVDEAGNRVTRDDRKT